MMERKKLDSVPQNTLCHKSTHDKCWLCIGSGNACTCTTIESGLRRSSAATSEKDAGALEVARGCAAAGKDDEEEEEEQDKDKQATKVVESRTPDGGWGWMVALGTLILTTLSYSLPNSFGILFSGFLLQNGASSTTTAWIYNLFLVLWSLSMILTNPLCQEFGERSVGFFSIFLAFLSLLLSGFSPSVSFLYFSFSLIGGLSMGLNIGIANMVLPPYFDKKIGRANTFLVTGAPVAQMLLSPFCRYLLETYSLQGAALIYGAIMFNGLIGVSFFQPVKWHLKPSSGERPGPQHDTLQPLVSGKDASPRVSTDTSHAALAPKASDSNPSVQRLRLSNSGSVLSVLSARSDAPVRLVYLSHETEEPTAVIKPRFAKAFGRTLSRVGETIKSDVTVLRQFKCVILAVTLMITQTTMYSFIMMLPFIIMAADHSLQDAASCIAVLGVTNLFTRLVVSPLSDCKIFSIRICIMLGYFLRALGATAASLSSELWQFMASSVLSSLGIGFSLSMSVPSIIHYMKKTNLRPTLGIVGLVVALGFPTIGPLIGFIRDTTDSYSASLYVMAALDLLSMGLWFLMPAAQARDART